jgi:small GTP-binding protein
MTIEGKTVKVQIWDTAGQELYRSVTASYYRGTNAIVIVYDVTSQESFDHVQYWFDQAHKYGNKAALVYLVAAKIDISDMRVVTKGQGESVARSLSAGFAETSSLTNQGVDEMCLEIATNLLNTPEGKAAMTATKGINAGPATGRPVKTESSCC